MALLEIENLTVTFGGFQAVDEVTLRVEQGETLGVVGESGCGKSVAMLALMGLVAFPGIVHANRVHFDGRELSTLSNKVRRTIIGKDIAMIFQEPMTSLNPCFTVGFQIMETIKVHQGGSRKDRRRRAIELLQQVGIPDPDRRLGSFPHQLSGGMNQRVMIAMAIACNPKLLIADEPTTALDVTIQAQILDLLLTLQRQRGMALILITHDMGVIAETAQRVNVMYAGQIVEQQSVNDLFRSPRHPYTRALLAALPERGTGRHPLPTIPGVVPGPHDRPHGCLFNPRCDHAQKRCQLETPDLIVDNESAVRCYFPIAAQHVSGVIRE